jgi:hypothetical protein
MVKTYSSTKGKNGQIESLEQPGKILHESISAKIANCFEADKLQVF